MHQKNNESQFQQISYTLLPGPSCVMEQIAPTLTVEQVREVLPLTKKNDAELHEGGFDCSRVCCICDLIVSQLAVLLRMLDSNYRAVIEDNIFGAILSFIVDESSNTLLRRPGSITQFPPFFNQSVVDSLKSDVITLRGKLIRVNLVISSAFEEFGKVPTESINVLNEYLIVADSILKDSFMKKLRTEVLKHREITRSVPYCPFVFICAPSGSGKTNCAFAFPSPFLYLISDVEYGDDFQNVYMCFTPQSDVFWRLLKEDMKEYAKTNVPNRRNIAKMVVVEKVQKCDIPFKSVGFICALFEATLRKWETSEINFAKAQMQLPSINYKPMQFHEAKKFLSNILMPYCLKDEPYLLPIFIDECTLLAKQIEGTDKAIVHVFARSVLRCMDCTPVYMGTNASASNFVGNVSSTNTFSGTTGVYPWCLVVYRLPNATESYVNGIKKSVIVQFTEKQYDMICPSNSSIDFLFKYLRIDRPIFITYAIKYIEELLNGNMKINGNVDFMNSIFEFILSEFRERKNRDCILNIGQLSFMMAYYWDGKISHQKAANKGALGSDLAIHGHMAFLAGIPQDRNDPFYFSLATRSRNIKNDLFERVYWKSTYTNSRRAIKNAVVFDPTSVFEDFAENPVTGLVCAGFLSANASTLFRNEYRVSTFNSVVEDNETVRDIFHLSGKPSGFILEMALTCALIIASRAGGPFGCSIEDFLKHLLREMNWDLDYPEQPLPISFHTSFLTNYKEVKIPFCSPMATSNWNGDFVMGLSNISGGLKNEIKLGYIDPIRTSSGSADTNAAVDSLMRYYDGSLVLVAECKLYNAKIGKYELDEIIEKKFAEFNDCKLFLIAAPIFANSKEFYQEDYCLWILKKHARTGQLMGYTQTIYNAKQEVGAKKHVILLELDSISTRRFYTVRSQFS